MNQFMSAVLSWNETSFFGKLQSIFIILEANAKTEKSFIFA